MCAELKHSRLSRVECATGSASQVHDVASSRSCCLHQSCIPATSPPWRPCHPPRSQLPLSHVYPLQWSVSTIKGTKHPEPEAAAVRCLAGSRPCTVSARLAREVRTERGDEVVNARGGGKGSCVAPGVGTGEATRAPVASTIWRRADGRFRYLSGTWVQRTPPSSTGLLVNQSCLRRGGSPQAQPAAGAPGGPPEGRAKTSRLHQ